MADEWDELDPSGDEEQQEDEPQQQPAPVDVEALRAQITQEVQQGLETKFQQDKAALFSGLRTRAKDLLGVEITDDYEFKPVDPRRTWEFASRASAPQEPEPEEEIPDAFTDPVGHRRWVRAEAAKVAANSLQESAVAKELAAMRGELERLRGLAYQPLQAGLPAQARQVLADYGMEALADDADYVRDLSETVQKAINAGHLPPDALSNSAALESAALMVAPRHKAKLQAQRQQPGQQEQRPRNEAGQFVPNPNRALLAAAQPSRGSGPSSGGIQLSEDEQIAMELAGITDPRQWRALESGGAYSQYQEQSRRATRR
jgi:hypothetical protein